MHIIISAFEAALCVIFCACIYTQVLTDAVELVIRAVRDARHDVAIEVVRWFSRYFDRLEFRSWLTARGGWVKNTTTKPFSPD